MIAYLKQIQFLVHSWAKLLAKLAYQLLLFLFFLGLREKLWASHHFWSIFESFCSVDDTYAWIVLFANGDECGGIRGQWFVMY